MGFATLKAGLGRDRDVVIPPDPPADQDVDAAGDQHHVPGVVAQGARWNGGPAETHRRTTPPPETRIESTQKARPMATRFIRTFGSGIAAKMKQIRAMISRMMEMDMGGSLRVGDHSLTGTVLRP